MNHRVDVHGIDATSARRRGSMNGSTPSMRRDELGVLGPRDGLLVLFGELERDVPERALVVALER